MTAKIHPHIGPHRTYFGVLCVQALCFECGHAEYVATKHGAGEKPQCVCHGSGR